MEMKILAAAIVAFCVLTVPPEPVAAQFELVEEVRLDRPATPPGEPFITFNSCLLYTSPSPRD